MQVVSHTTRNLAAIDMMTVCLLDSQVASVSPDTLLISNFVGMGAVAVNFSMTCRPLPAGWSLMHNKTGGARSVCVRVGWGRGEGGP
jgi:hypothetical protein